MKKRLLLTVLFLSYALFVFSGGEKELHVQQDEVSYYPEKGIKGYLSYPAEEGTYPVILLIHEWWGLNDYVKQRAKDLSRQGYIALAVDLYGKPSTKDPSKAREMATEVRSNVEEAFNNLKAAINFAKTSIPNASTERIASLGWCFGGGWSYEMAKNDLGTKVSVMYYGRFSPADDLSQMKALILGNFGEEDRSIKVDDVRQFQATLKTLNGEHEVYIYPNAGHAFDNNGNPNYNKEASDLAWSRTLAFLKKHL